MNTSLKLFNLKEKPVTISYWFFLLFLFFSPLTTLGIFISVLLHEMAHFLVADKKGCYLHGIDIGLFYGSATFERTHDRDLIWITLAGPMSNLLLFGLFYLINFLHPIAFIHDLYMINLILFIFNIIPIYPMDGGQIIRSFANLRKNRYQARKIASIISLVFSILLFVFGIVTSYYILSIFSIYFIYSSVKDLK